MALLVLGDFVWQSPFSQVFEVPHNSSILHESLNSALQHSCGLRLEKKKKKRKQEMYTNLVILIMRLQSTHALAWLSAGREHVVT